MKQLFNTLLLITIVLASIAGTSYVILTAKPIYAAYGCLGILIGIFIFATGRQIYFSFFYKPGHQEHTTEEELKESQINNRSIVEIEEETPMDREEFIKLFEDNFGFEFYDFQINGVRTHDYSGIYWQIDNVVLKKDIIKNTYSAYDKSKF